MPRVKRGTTHVKRRRKLLKAVKGFKWGRKNLIRLAKTADTKAGAHAFVDRRKKKRDRRALWQVKINAFARENKPKESNAGFIELTFALVKCELGISKLLEYCFKSFVIISLCLAKNDDIIAYV